LLLCVFFFSVPAPPPDLHSFPTRRSSDLTLSTEPSSSAIRARAFTWVFTRSSQFTTVFAAAEMVLALRAMFTAGMMRETSPARCPAACGAAQVSEGMVIKQESSTATPRAHGDFFV